MKNSGLHIVPIDTNIVDTFSPPPLAPDQNPCAPSPTTPMRATTWRWECRIRPPRPTVPIDTANRPLLTPPNGLCTAHDPTTFPATVAIVTELPDDVNRSIGGTYCIGTARRWPIRGGCGHHRLQPHHRRRRVVHIIFKLIVISIVFSSFNNVDLFCSMSANCCMPWRRGWGAMAAVG
jgi:hypothetical protein